MTMSDTARAEFLQGLGLASGGDTLAASIEPTTPAAPATPTGRDPRTIPVSEIVFDPALLAEFPSLDGPHMAAASRKIFAMYQGPKGDPRNKELHRAISTFITTARRFRQTGGMVTQKVASTKRERDLAALLAETGVTDADLAAALQHIATTRTQA